MNLSNTNRHLKEHIRGGYSLDWRPQALLLAALAIMFLPWLGDILFNSKGEPREAIVAVSIVRAAHRIKILRCWVFAGMVLHRGCWSCR